MTFTIRITFTSVIRTVLLASSALCTADMAVANDWTSWLLVFPTLATLFCGVFLREVT